MDVTFEGVRAIRHGRVVLDVPGLHLRGGSVTALLGPNGAGKTTLLRLIAGLERPAAGTVATDGVPVRNARQMRQLVGFAFQEPVFVSGTVRDNLELGLALRGVPATQRRSQAQAASAALDLVPLLGRNVHRLSGGEAQRVNLARALALRAPLTLLDEPLAGLDAPAQRQLLAELPALMAEFARTTILVTHSREEAMRLADNLVIIIDGSIRSTGEKARVFRSPPDDETALFLGYALLPSGNATVAVPPGGLRAGPGVHPFSMRVTAVIDTGAQFEVSGTIGDVFVHTVWASEPPQPGAHVCVSWSPR